MRRLALLLLLAAFLAQAFELCCLNEPCCCCSEATPCEHSLALVSAELAALPPSQVRLEGPSQAHPAPAASRMSGPVLSARLASRLFLRGPPAPLVLN